MNILEKFMILFSIEGAEQVRSEMDKTTQSLDKAAAGAEKSGKSFADSSKKTAEEIKKKNEESEKSNKDLSEKNDKRRQKEKNAIAGIVGEVSAFKTACLKSAALISAAMIPVFATIKATRAFANQAEDLLFMSYAAGVASKSLQGISNAAIISGGSVGSTASTLENLTKQVQALKFGESPALAQAAIKYGLRLGSDGKIDSPEQMLKNIAKRFETMNHAQKIDLATMIGLDQGTFRMLYDGLKSYEEELALVQHYNVINKEDVKNANKLNESIRELGLAIKALNSEIGRTLIPNFIKVIEGLINIVNSMRNGVWKKLLIALSSIHNPILFGATVKWFADSFLNPQGGDKAEEYKTVPAKLNEAIFNIPPIYGNPSGILPVYSPNIVNNNIFNISGDVDKEAIKEINKGQQDVYIKQGGAISPISAMSSGLQS